MYYEEDDGFDYLIKDKTTGQLIAKISNQNEVLPFAYRRGRDTVTIEKVNRKEMNEMSMPNDNIKRSTSVVSLTEMKIENVKEDLLIPSTSNPEKEAKELTDETGVYHYTVNDDMTGKKAIVRTNVKALNEDEWIKKSFYTPDSNVIEPNNFEKNDEYEVSSTRQVAEGYDRDKWEAGYEAFENGQPCPTDPSGKDGWMEAKKEHRKAGQMNEDDDSDISDWREVYTGIFKHNYLPLAYDDNSGQVVLYDISNASSLEDSEVVGVFDSVEEMKNWIAANLKEDVAEEYRNAAPQVTEEENIDFASLSDEELERGRKNAWKGRGTLQGLELADKFRAEQERRKQEVTENDEEVSSTATSVAIDNIKKIDESETSNIVGAERGVNNDNGSNYGPAPTDDQNDLDFDAEGRVIIEADEFYIYQPGPDDQLKIIFYQTNPKNPNSDDLFIGDTVLRSPNDLEREFPREQYGNYKFVPLSHDGRRFDDEEHFTFSYDDIMKDLTEFGSGSGVEEGKDMRYDPDADDEDYDRQDRYKRRAQERNSRYAELDESNPYADDDDERRERRAEDKRYNDEIEHSKHLDEDDVNEITRAFLLSIDFTPERIEIEHKGMADVDSALALMADGRPIDKFRAELDMGGLPMVSELERDNALTVMVLASTAKDAIDTVLNLDIVHRVLYEFEIDDSSFLGLLAGKVGSSMDLTGELTEDDEFFEAPELVVSTEDLESADLAQDPMFKQVMKDAYLTVAEKYGERLESFDPTLEQIDEVIATGIDSYPNGQRFSFLIDDRMAHDAVVEAFNILWDQGVISSAE